MTVVEFGMFMVNVVGYVAIAAITLLVIGFILAIVYHPFSGD